MKKKLRPYQENGIFLARKALSEGFRRIIMRADTGSGKTFVFTWLCDEMAKNNKKVLVLTDRIELLNQTGDTFSDSSVKRTLVSAKTKYIPTTNVVVGMAQTLKRRMRNYPEWLQWLQSIDVLIIDECHKQEFNSIIDLCKDKIILGFTATPVRSGNMRQLGIDYETIIDFTSVSELIKSDFLVPDDYMGVKGVNLQNIKIDAKTGDYNPNDQFSRFNKPQLYSGVVKHYIKHTPDTSALVFCVNIEHCIKTCLEFVKHGINAKFIVSKKTKPKLPKEDCKEGIKVKYLEDLRIYNLYEKQRHILSGNRETIFKDFKERKTLVLVNVAIATTGFDYRGLETIIISKSTLSSALWHQMIGRGSRPSKNKTHFNIADFGDNASRLGHYTARRVYSLWHLTVKEGGGIAPVKECGISGDGLVLVDENGKKGCKTLIPVGMKICEFCGFKKKTKKQQEIELKAIALDTFNKRILAFRSISEMSHDELEEYRKLKGHKSAWLWLKLFNRGGLKELEQFGKKRHWSEKTFIAAKKFCLKLY